MYISMTVIKYEHYKIFQMLEIDNCLSNNFDLRDSKLMNNCCSWEFHCPKNENVSIKFVML